MGNIKLSCKEQVPNKNHWEQELIIRQKRECIQNKTLPLDEKSYTRINRIETEDELIDINTISLGKQKDDINMINFNKVVKLTKVIHATEFM